ncbi:hypothetical protein [Ewingella americana]|uniref:Uncharacterized protein n=2 Tax=Ewingella americana TaxID=41202 RepID=A0A085G6S4_EWIA3|nr:hypothetical protein [Ewingella americana]KFC79419.1 hypothetical protein GEAM_3228 [Ewingella americana ATCC 33852]STQ42823.1 Uncharacterised protein [Ewingella americana]
MTQQATKISAEKANAAAQRSVDFWAKIDGSKLAKVGLKEKDMDLVGQPKSQKMVKLG